MNCPAASWHAHVAEGGTGPVRIGGFHAAPGYSWRASRESVLPRLRRREGSAGAVGEAGRTGK
jgi:hypothetical protein